ncbi:Glycerophosphodiester phosphodiesterase GDPD3 [Hibiscus syriacus]|uniref:glycerophosphodiester phosphodiesterase n=1 Tax=Hibiscus syriacus TaxID=106335 RepID=A0A6A3BM46_HIBSY|nr:Glycerophosphodiester phosphodiesterase GDPD3 [Hibiscus syriacus]
MGAIVENRVTELTLAEFLSYGPQKFPGTEGKPILRKLKDGRIFEWKVDKDAPLCTLEGAFQNVDRSVGFNVELKFDDLVDYTEGQLPRILKAILKVVFENAEGRAVMFSSFQPDAVRLIRKLQSAYPVYFLTNGGTEIYADVRNSLDEAIKLCVDNGLQGIVSEVKAVFRNPGAVARIKELKLSLITYGQLNNVPEVVYMQYYLMGFDGVIVDLVKEISKSVSDVTRVKEEEEKSSYGEDGKMEAKAKPQFSIEELSFLMKLIPELMIQP